MTAKELKEQLSKEYPVRIEMHAHTYPVSPCSEVKAEELAEIYSKEGYDAVVLANHYILSLPEFNGLDKEQVLECYEGAFKEFEKACEKYGLKAIFGAEIRFTENNNDYLIYGVDREVLSVAYDYFTKGLEAYRTEVKLDKSVFIQAHPFRNGITAVEPSLLDGIESFNMHPGHNSRVGIAAKYAKENCFDIKIAGTDFHHPNQKHEGVSALRTRTLPKDSFELAEILRSGDYILEIGGDSLVLA